MSDTRTARTIEEASHERQERLTAILAEHLPAELRATVQQEIEGLVGDAYAIADEMERQCYGVLIAMLPDHGKQVRAAWSAVLNADCEDDWESYERGLPLTIMPETRLKKLLGGDLDALAP